MRGNIYSDRFLRQSVRPSVRPVRYTILSGPYLGYYMSYHPQTSTMCSRWLEVVHCNIIFLLFDFLCKLSPFFYFWKYTICPGHISATICPIILKLLQSVPKGLKLCTAMLFFSILIFYASYRLFTN